MVVERAYTARAATAMPTSNRTENRESSHGNSSAAEALSADHPKSAAASSTRPRCQTNPDSTPGERQQQRLNNQQDRRQQNQQAPPWGVGSPPSGSESAGSGRHRLSPPLGHVAVSWGGNEDTGEEATRRRAKAAEAVAGRGLGGFERAAWNTGGGWAGCSRGVEGGGNVPGGGGGMQSSRGSGGRGYAYTPLSKGPDYRKVLLVPRLGLLLSQNLILRYGAPKIFFGGPHVKSSKDEYDDNGAWYHVF